VPRDRAIARTAPAPSREDLQRRDEQARREAQARAAEQRRVEENRRNENNRRYDNNGRSDNRGYDNRGYGNGRYDNRGYAYGARRYDSHNRYYYYYPAPRVIYPTVVRVVPYRPYVYRPSYSLGVFYGSGGYYPYGYTPSYYYQPVPGRVYGGVRITGAPRDARVFADGYFVGIVNDFDGIFQHLNLEAGRHHIEIDWGGYQPIAFDVYVRPGETTTFRADGYY
jgi:PEGA domain